MAIIKNSTSFKLKFAVYRADGLLMSNTTPVLESGDCLEVNGGDTKGIDWFILLIFLKDSVIPPAVNVTQQTQGVGVTLGLTVAEIGGFTIGVNIVGTTNFSTPLAGKTIGDNDRLKLEKTSSLQLSFLDLDASSTCSNTHQISSLINR